jgi:hypothetical protein
MVPKTLPTKHVGIGCLILSMLFLVVIVFIYPSSLYTSSSDSSSLRSGVSMSVATEVVDDSPTSSATSGKLFKGEKVNSFDRSKLLFNSYVAEVGPKEESTTHLQDSLKCDYWSVVTTIFEPSDAILKQAEVGFQLGFVGHCVISLLRALCLSIP